MNRTRLGALLIAVSALGSGSARAWDLRWFDLMGATGFDAAGSVVTDATGAYLLGVVTGALPGQTPAGGRDAFLRKYSLSGAVLWTRQFGTPSNEFAEVVAIHDGDIFVMGVTAGTLPGQTSQGSQDVFVRRYTPDGDVVWTSQFGTPGFDAAGGLAVNENGVFVAGYFFEGSQGPSQLHAYLARLDTDDGAFAWRQNVGPGTTAQPPSTAPASVAVDATGVYFIANVAGTMPFRKYDFAGQELWARDIDDVEDCFVYGFAVSAYGGRVSMIGQVDKAFWEDTSTCQRIGVTVGGLRTFDADGNLLWKRAVEAGPVAGEHTFTGGKVVHVTASGVYVASNTTTTFAGFTPRTPRPDYSQCTGLSDPFFDALDAYVRRYDNDGNVIWTQQFGGTVFDLVQGLGSGPDTIFGAGYTSCSFMGLPYNGGTGDAFVVSFAVDPQTAGGKTHLVVGRLETLKDQARVTRADFDNLARHLTRAADAIGAGETLRARQALQTFLRGVTRVQRLGGLTEEDAAALASAAQAVLKML
ncbi:MAG TPA: PQQ-binding-like beta-propeller repeat protein [Vicinamibacteria bacterium]|nr:PQQ-binding-like beta-propeller repeat protein [Vicinamibacteria bacterium]